MPQDEENPYARTVLLDLDVVRPITDIPSLREFMRQVVPLEPANPKGIEVFERFLQEYKLETFLQTHGHLLETITGRHLRVDRSEQATHFFAGSFFQDSGGRIFVPLYVRQGNICTINFYYTSGSQMPFRLLPFVAVDDFGKWYSKGPNGEHSLNAPFEVQAVLYKWLKQDLQAGKPIPDLSINFMPNQLDCWMKKDEAPIDNRLKQVQRIQSIRALRKALDPESEGSQVFELGSDAKDVFRQNAVEYAQFAQSPYGAEFGLEKVLCRDAHSPVYTSPDLVTVPSFNGEVYYLFVQTKEGSFLAATELSNSKLNLHGLNRDILGNFPELWLTPLCEYDSQIHSPLRARYESNGVPFFRGRYVLIDNLCEVVEFVGEFERAQKGETVRFTRKDIIPDDEASMDLGSTFSITLTSMEVELPANVVSSASVQSPAVLPKPWYKRAAFAAAALLVAGIGGLIAVPHTTASSVLERAVFESYDGSVVQPEPVLSRAADSGIASVAEVHVPNNAALPSKPDAVNPTHIKHPVKNKPKPQGCTKENVLSVLERKFGQGTFIVSKQGVKRPYDAEFKPFPIRCSTQMRCSTSQQKCISR